LRGLGIALGRVVCSSAACYDGLVLVASRCSADYPIERPILALTFANPVDLARVPSSCSSSTVAALMGYTGAVFQRVFSGPLGPVAGRRHVGAVDRRSPSPLARGSFVARTFSFFS
jgi:Cu-processing system permease protein